MRFQFSDEQEMLRRTVRTFAERELSPVYLRELDAAARAPHWELLPKMAALGFTALPVPAAYGGLDSGMIDVAVMLEELGRTSLSVASMLHGAIGFGCEAIKASGTEAQRSDFLPRVVAGEMCFACALAEPDAGIDAAAIRTQAVRDQEGFLIDGDRVFTTGVEESRCLVIAARTDRSAPPHRGISLFLVDPRTPGISLRRIEKLGMRGAGGLVEVRCEKVRVPQTALLGELNRGWEAVEAALHRVRICEAAYCIGCAQQVIEDAVRYANERQQFGQPIGKFQAISHLLVDLQVQVDAARWLLYRAAWLAAHGKPCEKEASMANLACTAALAKVTSDAMRVYGGYGLTMEFDIQRHFRDARLFVTGNRSSRMQRNLIAERIGL